MSIEHMEATITGALRLAADYFTDAAAEARKGAEAPEVQRAPITHGTVVSVDITPTPAGFGHMARVFDEQAREAIKLAERIEAIGLRRAVTTAA
jgi:hypothetical protein